MVHAQVLRNFFVLSASFAVAEVAVHLKGTESLQSAAAPQSYAQGTVENIGATRPAGWDLVEESVKSLRKTERGTVSVTQIREAVKSLSARLGNKVAQGPMGVERFITENLLPQATQTRNEMQAEVDAAKKKVEDCSSLMWSAEKEVEHREKILLEDESGRYQCIAREHQLHTLEMNKCNEKLAFQRSLSPPVHLDNVSKTPQAWRQALTLNHEFYTQAYPEFMNRKSACDDAAAAAEAQLSECDADEAVIEQFYCKMKAGRDEACSKYETCYSEQTDAYAAKIAKIQELEAKVKEQFQTMACEGQNFGSEGEDTVSECDPNSYETNHLDVHYPSTPRQETCVSLVDTRRDYSAIVCDGETVVSGNASRGHGSDEASAGAGSNTTASGSNATAPVGNGSF